MIYRAFTGSSQAPFYDLQGFYRVKFVLLFQFTGVLQQTKGGKHIGLYPSYAPTLHKAIL